MLLTELQIKIVKQLKGNQRIGVRELLDNLGIKQEELTDALAGMETVLRGQIMSSANNASRTSPTDDSAADISLEPNLLLDDGVIWGSMTKQARDTFATCELVLSTESTNKQIKDMPPGSLLLAEQQTGGRGRYGRSWLSPFASGIYLSVALGSNKFAQGTDGLSLAIGVILVKFLHKLGVGIGLKWPNDLLTSIDPVSKLGGILVELSDEQVIIGMGINYRQPYSEQDAQPNRLPDKQIVGVEDLMSSEARKTTDRSLATGMLINHLAEGLEVFCQEGFTAYQEKWNQLNILANLELNVDTGAEVITGVCGGVDTHGRLLITNKRDNKTTAISSGSIKL